MLFRHKTNSSSYIELGETESNERAESEETVIYIPGETFWSFIKSWCIKLLLPKHLFATTKEKFRNKFQKI